MRFPKVLDTAIELISRPSVTPDDAGCQAWMTAGLEALGFKVESMRFGEVDNLWAVHGEEGPLFVFLGHTDVVPTGPLDAWGSDPFKPEIRDGMLYGRGAADMKGSVAAFLCAVQDFIDQHADHKGRLAILLTSDEEGPSIDGTRKVIEALAERGEQIDYCLVGEPSSKEKLGDVIRIGRRGSLGGILNIKGVQGHVAYPDLAENPIHKAAAAIAELVACQWDEGGDGFPSTGFQVSNIHAGTGANNVIPGQLDLEFNFRFGVASPARELQMKVHEILDRHELKYGVDWKLSGMPFVTTEGPLLDAVCKSIKKETGLETIKDTGGGTSDGRFVAPTGAQVVELGPVNATIHKINECVAVDDLELLQKIYCEVLLELMA